MVRGVDAVWDSGIVVVVAAGNNGPEPMSISTPGISRKVITVGASDDNVPIELSGNKMIDYSGRGPTLACIKKPDIVAPGSDIISCNALKNYSRYLGMKDTSNTAGRNGLFRSPLRLRFNSRGEKYNIMYTSKSGTSMATPIVTGAIALLLSVHPELSNRDVKMKLRESTTDLGYSWSKQGCGLLNVEKLLQ
ncbi:hypothetical protein bsdtb5_32420 [Anaeromicropila herbilytica]|uniref:Peptidase S8/S53 domain-containing protein n=1 Tax=Anaeromicropila herbilytica TaxID=2785025 RepID=A0A7R7ENB1_9FIRM|nr:hypothetical protein bsdtb5_32420 [Anaeromicropila herbilytica]